ncbi:MAG: hypothetical protein IT410_03535 [Candidatus Doudnabacteria bacterium]|nr:hypothetical protein [Candidatus Doudnabacteria bacterium]
MNNDRLSFIDWEFWAFGSVYGFLVLVGFLIFTDSAFGVWEYGIPAIFLAFAVFMLAISSARHKRNKRWLDEFNSNYAGSLDLDVVVAVTNRVCTMHRGCPRKVMFRLVAEALYNRARNVPPVNTFHKWAINAYEELYGE